jgi:hypothetical protein
MTFTVADFHDLVRLLEERPEWRAEIRRLVLSEELLAVPDLMRGLSTRVDLLTAAQRRTDEQLVALTAAQRRTDEQLSVLVAAQARSEEQLSVLVAAQARSEERLSRVEERLGHVEGRLEGVEVRLGGVEERLNGVESQLAEVRGDFLEIRYERRAGAYFARLLRRVRVVDPEELDRLLDEGLHTAALTDDEMHEIRLADLILRGRRPGEETESYVVVEVSAGIRPDDVRRAAQRALLLARVRPAIAAVAGDRVNADGAQAAAEAGAWVVLRGRVMPPNGVEVGDPARSPAH